MEKALISVAKVSYYNSSIHIPVQKQSIINSDLPVFMWARDGKICLTQNESIIPKKIEPLIAGVKFYERSKSHRKPAPTLVLGKTLTEPTNMRGKYVAFYEEGEMVVLSPATQEEMESRSGKCFHGETKDGEIRSGQNMYLSHNTRDRLSLKKGDRVKIVLNIRDGVWLEISKASIFDNMPGLQTVMYEKGLKYTMSPDEIPPLEYTARYADSLKLPILFLRAAGVDVTKREATQLPYRFESTNEGAKMILEGLPQTCAVCGKTVSSYKHKTRHLTACPDCLPPLEAVRTAVDKYGSLDAALEASDSELEEILLNTADRLTELTKLLIKKGLVS
jgi:hypothetical protein